MDIASRARGAAAQGRAEVVLERRKIGLEELASRNDHHVQRRPRSVRDVPAEHLAYQPFGSIPDNSVANLPARHQPEPRGLSLVGNENERDESSVCTRPGAERVLELGPPADPPLPGETLGLHAAMTFAEAEVRPRYAEEETVRRFRPLARRRLRTSRPFFVLMRTRKPCVRRR